MTLQPQAPAGPSAPDDAEALRIAFEQTAPPITDPGVAPDDREGYDPDAYMPVKELREQMDPPWDFGTWTKIKTANSWLRFDPKAPKNRPRIHRADAERMKTGQLRPDTFELIDKGDHPSLEELTDEYLADAAARKAEIGAKKRRHGS